MLIAAACSAPSSSTPSSLSPPVTIVREVLALLLRDNRHDVLLDALVARCRAVPEGGAKSEFRLCQYTLLLSTPGPASVCPPRGSQPLFQKAPGADTPFAAGGGGAQLGSPLPPPALKWRRASFTLACGQVLGTWVVGRSGPVACTCAAWLCGWACGWAVRWVLRWACAIGRCLSSVCLESNTHEALGTQPFDGFGCEYRAALRAVVELTQSTEAPLVLAQILARRRSGSLQSL